MFIRPNEVRTANCADYNETTGGFRKELCRILATGYVTESHRKGVRVNFGCSHGNIL